MKYLRCLIALLTAAPALAAQASPQETVILLHGLGRTSRSMAPLEKELVEAGYKVRNAGYPSRSASIEHLSETVVGSAIEECRRDGAVKIHFITHSLGGILVRSYLARHAVPSLGRVVMLAPPSQGSELVDKLGQTAAFKWICGPAGQELGTGGESLCCKLGPATFELGIIAGNRSVNWINSFLIPGADDGKVSVERTKLPGMTGHIVLPATHPFIMRNREAIEQSIQFLRTGAFNGATAAARSETGI